MPTEPTPCDLLVTADLIMTLDAAGRIVKNGAIAVTDRAIVDIGPAEELRTRWTPAKTVDGKGRIVAGDQLLGLKDIWQAFALALAAAMAAHLLTWRVTGRVTGRITSRIN